MPANSMNAFARRDVLAGAFAVAVALPAAVRAQTVADPAADAVRRLAMLAVRNALTKLSQPEGFWKSEVGRFGLPVLFRRPPGNAGPLGTDAFRSDLQHRLNHFAEAGARGAIPAVEAAAQRMVVNNPQAVLKGLPTAATSLLRLEMAAGLVNALLTPLEQALVAAQDPMLAQAMAVLPGVTLHDVAHAVALGADSGIWYEVGAAEAAIRKSPEASGDAALIAALRAQ